jgi:flagellar biogenesis protein FliO
VTRSGFSISACALVFSVALGSAASVWAQRSEPAASPTPNGEPPPGATRQPPPVRDLTSDTPPPSSWDLAQRRQGVAPEPEEGRSLASQLIRTVLSLALVVGLIYLVARFGLSKMSRMRTTPSGNLTVRERLQLDTKTALYIIEVAGEGRFLIGNVADRGLSVLATLTPVDGKPAHGKSFEQSLHKAGAAPSASDAPDPRFPE